MKRDHRTSSTPAPAGPLSRYLEALVVGSVGLAVLVLFGLWPPYDGDLHM